MKFNICKRKIASVILLAVLAAVLITLIISGFKISSDINFMDESVAGRLLYERLPAFYSFESIDLEFLKGLALGFDIRSPMSLITSNVLAFAAAKEPPSKEFETPQPEDLSNAKPIKETTISAGSSGYYEADGVKVKNLTAYTFDAAELLNEPLVFDFNADGPLVLIVHSHSSEAYTATDKNYYLPTDPDRTENTAFNVVRVGTEIANTLNKNGVETLHDSSLHDYPSYNGSYKSSLASVKSYLEKYPSIRIVLDIHRDAMVQADGTKLKLVTDIGGKKAAQIMLLTGSDQGGLDHPNWRENLKFAMKLQRVFNNMYPTLARPVSFTKERYNTHTTKGSVIIEVGTTGNTLEEALVSAQMIGNAVAEFISQN